MIAAQIIFWCAVIALFHSYVFYPVLLRILGSGVRPKEYPHLSDSNLPEVYLLMAVHNEETVIQQKLQSILDTDYPKAKLHVIIGSDCSIDATNSIIEKFSKNHPELRLYFKSFSKRTGKVGIVNQLYARLETSSDSILLLTDANAFFDKALLRQIVAPFTDPSIGLVGANILNSGIRKDGISHHEKTYIQEENRSKYLEGRLWGAMMGAFGACYALRSKLFTPVPEGFKVDDFYISMKVLEEGYRTVKAPAAICYEDVSNELSEEFRRKVRISAGSYQNLAVFYKMLAPGKGMTAFAFLSHKVLRWLGPFFLITAYFSALFLAIHSNIYLTAFLIQNLLLLILPLEWLLKKAGIHLVPLRFISYFYSMNAALLVGAFKYLIGDHQNVWAPTKRNQ